MSSKSPRGPIDGALAARQCLKRWRETKHAHNVAALPRHKTESGLWISDGFSAYRLTLGRDQLDAEQAMSADDAKRNVTPSNVLGEKLPAILATVPEDAPARELTRMGLRLGGIFGALFAGLDDCDLVDSTFLAPLRSADGAEWRWRQAGKHWPIVGNLHGEDTVILMPMHLGPDVTEDRLLYRTWLTWKR